MIEMIPDNRYRPLLPPCTECTAAGHGASAGETSPLRATGSDGESLGEDVGQRTHLHKHQEDGENGSVHQCAVVAVQ